MTLPLFETAPYAGVSLETRQTSAAAAEAVAPDARTLRERLYRAIVCHGGLTDDEAQRRLNMSGNTQRPRRRELEAVGRITKGGTRRTASGRLAVVWVANDR